MSSTKLVTQCPHCDTRFRITAEQLDAAGGKARCSRCQRVFNARAYLQAGDGKASRGESSHRASHAAAPHSKPPSPPPATESPEFTSAHSTDLTLATDADASAGAGQLDFDLASDFEVPGDQFSAQPWSTESADDFQSIDAPSLEPETAWVDESESVFEAETLEPRQDVDTFGTELDAAGKKESANAFDSAEQAREDTTPAADPASSVEFSISEGDDLTNERADQAWNSSITATAYPVTASTPGELEFGFGELASTEIGAAESDAAEEGILDSPSWAADQPEAIDPLMISIAEIEAMDVDDHLESIPETLPNPEAATTERPDDRPAANQTHADDEPLDDTYPPETSYEQALDALSPKNDATESLFSEWGHSAAAELTDEFPPGDEETPVEAEDEIAVVFEEAQHPLGSEVLFDEPESEPEPEPESKLESESESELPESDAAHPLPETEGRTATLYGNALAQELEATLAQRTQRLPTLLFGVGSLVLLALLLVQALNTFRDDVSRYPALAPIAGLFCEAQECVTPEQRAPDRIRIVNRDVRPHPDVAGALLISLSFLNEAEFPQAYPTLEVSFSDIHDQLIALRRFQPSEYLGGERRSSNPLPPGELVALSLSIVDPGEHGVSFRFEFY